METPQEIICRSDCFRLFSACFYEPDKDVFLDENVCLNLSSLLSASAEAASAAKKMHSALVEVPQHDLILDYAALFVGPFELIAAPYGSVYLEKNRRLMGDSTVAAQRYYKAEGLKVETKEPPDHVALELEFMSFLCRKEAEAIEHNDQAEADRLRLLQSEFYNSTMRWLPAFCKKIQEGAQTDYYRSLGSCLWHFYATCEQKYASIMKGQ